jgi:nucleotide-binding universal stress UspA family protein
MEMKRILWPTDLSQNAEKALPYVNSLSQKYQAEIHILYVIEELGIHEPWYGAFDPDHMEKIHEWEEKKAGERLDKICEEYLMGCPLYIKHVATGDPAEEIIRLISEEKIDMVVMATRGRKGKFSFGSVTEKVLKNSPMMVVTIPA